MEPVRLTTNLLQVSALDGSGLVNLHSDRNEISLLSETCNVYSDGLRGDRYLHAMKNISTITAISLLCPRIHGWGEAKRTYCTTNISQCIGKYAVLSHDRNAYFLCGFDCRR